ncbi:MAG: glutamate--tRNA ligase family protein, partial [Verrucomicrobiota bacterium]
MTTPNADSANNSTAQTGASDFIRDIVAEHLKSGQYQKIITRFPPEPNGYLHIGHAKSICLNFGIAREFGGICNLRMDDTNPTKEDVEYVDSIQEDVRWLIGGWADQILAYKKAGATDGKGILVAKESAAEILSAENSADKFQAVEKTAERISTARSSLEPFYASDYFDQIYHFAVELIKAGKAYVCDLSPKDTDEYRGAPNQPGKESPWRNRSIEESLDLFQRMRAGEFPDGARTLRAKIDMASPNVWLRDPLLYRIRHTAHHHTGDKWCIYPMYDFAHCLSDSIEGVTHSICTLEFEVHRPLYDWILENLNVPKPRPHQYEFARLSLGYTVMSKRKLMQ